MAELPTGTVTFLFTDIEGSTRLLRSTAPGTQTCSWSTGVWNRPPNGFVVVCTVSGTQIHPSCCWGVFVDESAEAVASVDVMWRVRAD